MTRPSNPTIDQLRTFLAVVEHGSFAAAGRRLNRATSVISYAIGNLESQLGVTLFERESTKRPVLTEAGELVLAEARGIEQGLASLRARVADLAGGLEARLAIAVDVMFPSACLAAALGEFAAAFPGVALNLRVEAMGAVAEPVLAGEAMFGVAGPLVSELGGLERRQIAMVELIPVAAPSHPLAHARSVAPGLAADHVQLVLSDRSSLTQGREFSVISPRSWRLADLGAKHELLRQGLGWGNMPSWMVADDLRAGRLVQLQLPERPGGAYALYVIQRTDAAPGPAARWLAARLGQLDASIALARDLA